MNKPYDKDSAAQAASIRIYNDCVVPKASDGPIKVDLAQKVDGRIEAESSPSIYLQVQGPYERLQPTDVVGLYPAEGSDTSPEEFVPHIALERRSLPWERDGVKDDNGKATPWLTLLLLTESQIETVNATKVRTIPLSQLKTEDKKSHDAIAAAYSESTSLDIIRVKRDVLASVLPRKSELSLLCHVQQLVGPPASEEADAGDASDPMWTLDADCQVAIVVGNRLPYAGDGSRPPEKHYACLVSVEHRDDLPWPGAVRTGYSKIDKVFGVSAVADTLHPTPASPVAGKPPAPEAHVALGGLTRVVPSVAGSGIVQQLAQVTHLAVLRYWTFTPSAGGDFEEVMKLIRISPNGGVLRFGLLPRHLSPSHGIDTLTADGRLELDDKQGGKASFRGPLTPGSPPARSPGYALRAAPANPGGGAGEPDDTYASAFELGRLLTLADGELLADLQEVRLQLVMPRIAPVYEVPNPPAILQKKLWGPDPPDWGSIAGLPESAGDPAGVQSIVSQIDQIAGQLNPGGVQVGGGLAGGLIDIGAVAGGELDGMLAHVVAAQRS